MLRFTILRTEMSDITLILTCYYKSNYTNGTERLVG